MKIFLAELSTAWSHRIMVIRAATYAEAWNIAAEDYEEPHGLWIEEFPDTPGIIFSRTGERNLP